MKTTLNQLKKAGACENHYRHLLKALNKIEADDEPLEISKIIETNGIQDAIWALCAVQGHDREIRLFVADCAEMVIPIYEKQYPDDDRLRKGIQAARDYANGLISTDELAAAWDAAWDAGWDEAWAAAWDAAWDAAWAAARAAAWDAAWDEAWAAAWDAGWDEAWAAGWDEAWAAARAAAWAAAWDAAWAAAWDAAWDAVWNDIEIILKKYL